MLVRLKRNFYLEGRMYTASPYGVEMPEEINGTPVVSFDSPRRLEGNCHVLPRDAEILVGAQEPEPEEQDEPIALSEMNKKAARPKSFVEAMDKTSKK